MSTLRVSNIEAKADVSSPSVHEKIKVTNSEGDVLVHIDGATSGISTVGINTTVKTFDVDSNQNIDFVGNLTAPNITVTGTLSYDDVTNIDSVGVITARAGVDVNNGHIVLDSGYSLQWSDSHERIEQTDAKLKFFTNNTEKVTISGGNLGIGDVSPTYELEVASSDTTTLNITAGGNTNISRLFFSDGDAVARGYLNYEHNGDNLLIATAGSERLRITSAGVLQAAAGVNLQMASNGRIFVGNGGNATDPMFANVSDTNTGIAFPAADTMMFTTGGSERLRIDSGGTFHINSPDSASGGRIYAASSKLYLQSGNGRQSVNIADMASGQSATHEFNSSGNLVLDGGMQAASVNLQSSSTNSWFQTGANYGGTNYVWAAKDSSANVWHSGLQTDGDLLIGGNITGTSRIGLYGSSGNIGLTNVNTSAKLNVSTDLSGNYTGWKEKGVASGSMSQASIDSKTPTINDFTYPNSSNGMLIWSTSKIGFAAGGESPQYGTGVQMLFDSAGLMLGGIRSFDRTSSTSTSTNWNLKLNTAGSAVFKGQLEADPVLLDANDSWIKSTYGGISNSTVSSLNNLMIGQNMRGWIGTRDGGSPTNNFYNIITHSGLGYCGTEYCYQGITKFYNNTGATTANASFTPNETVRFDTSGLTVNNGLRISTTSGGNSLANPYSIGLITTATIPSYPHFTGIWVVNGSIPCNNTWYDLLHSINDSNGMFHGYSGDASSKNIFQYQYSLTSPAYGVNNLSQRFMNGAWNTGSVSFQLRNNNGPWTLQMKATSHYNSNNNAGFRIMFHSYY